MNSSSSEPSSSSRWLQQKFLLLGQSMMEPPTLTDGHTRSILTGDHLSCSHTHCSQIPVSVFWRLDAPTGTEKRLRGSDRDQGTLLHANGYMALS